jgi:hypothetical protein
LNTTHNYKKYYKTREKALRVIIRNDLKTDDEYPCPPSVFVSTSSALIVGQWSGGNWKDSCSGLLVQYFSDSDKHTTDGTRTFVCWNAKIFIILSSSSPYSWRFRRVSCSVVLKMKLVPPSLLRSSYVPSSFGSIL